LIFYYLVGKGKIDPKEIKKIKALDEKAKKTQPNQPIRDTETFPKKKSKKSLDKPEISCSLGRIWML
jgi:hypothetical protein